MKDLLRRILPAVLLAAACLYTYRLEVPETHTYPATGIHQLNAETQSGATSVTASADTVITVNVLKHAYGRDKADAEKAIANVVYSGTVVGDEMKVKTEMPSGPRPYGASFTITVPESTSLSLSTTNGGITISNTVGDINAGTTNGSIELTGTEGTAHLSTTNGALEVNVHRGGIEGATTNGAVDCDLAELGPTEAVTLETTNGAVTLLLPADVSATVDATNATVTVLDFAAVVYEVQTEHHVRARIGSGSSSITITTTNASITVRARS